MQAASRLPWSKSTPPQERAPRMLRKNYGFSRFTSLNQNRRVSRTGIRLVRSVNFQHPSGNDTALNTLTWRDGLLGRTLVVGSVGVGGQTGLPG